jgi:hypothetical protein
MPKTSLNTISPAKRNAFKQEIKRNLAEALRSLGKFSDSVRDGRTPDWPPEATYTLFMAQLDAFRLISKRRKNAPAIQLMREIDHTWHKLKVVDTVELFIQRLQDYIGNTLLGSANEKAQFERQNDRAKDQLTSLICKKKWAAPEDLDAMRDLLPVSFRHLDTLTSSRFVRRATGASYDTLQNLRIAVARSAQEYLFSEHLRFLERSAAAKRLRKFIFDRKYRPYTKKLFGFSQPQIQKWDDIDQLEAARVRQGRFRQKSKRKKRYASRRRRG